MLPSPAAASMAAAASIAAAARMPYQPPPPPNSAAPAATQSPPAPGSPPTSTSGASNNNNSFPLPPPPAAAAGPHPPYPRHPFLPPGLGAALGAYHNPSFQTLLAGLSAQRQKLGEGAATPPDFHALLTGSGGFPGASGDQQGSPRDNGSSDPGASPTHEQDQEEKPEIKSEHNGHDEDTKPEPRRTPSPNRSLPSPSA